MAEYHSEPVSVVGSVGNPGVIQLRGRKTLVEVIALAGGLKPDAGNSIVITREIAHGRIPLPGATDDADGRFSIAKVNLRSVMEARNPQDNILVKTNDVITIPKAQLLYVVGEVQRPGGYALNEKDTITVLQAVALAGGLTGKASPRRPKYCIRITIRPTAPNSRPTLRKSWTAPPPTSRCMQTIYFLCPTACPSLLAPPRFKPR